MPPLSDREHNVLTTYLFFREHMDDPNVELTKDQIAALRKESLIFVDSVDELVARLEASSAETEEDIMTIFYDVGKQFFGEEKSQLFRFFALLYLLVWGKKNGPRFGAFIRMYGTTQDFAQLVTTRMDEAKKWI